MELKTKVGHGAGSQDSVITREFDLPLQLLFKAFEDPDLLGQWMDRDRMLQMPFAQGINMAHNRIRDLLAIK